MPDKYFFRWNQDRECWEIYINGKWSGDEYSLKDAESRIEQMKQYDLYEQEENFRLQEEAWNNHYSQEKEWDSRNSQT